MLFDSCTWDDDYNLGVVQTIRQQLVALATPLPGYTSVLLQGSGSYAVEAVLGSVVGHQGKVLIVSNGAYGARMIEMAALMGVAHHAYDCGEVARPDVQAIEAILRQDSAITHIAMVHCETTTGMLNPTRRCRRTGPPLPEAVHRGCDEQLWRHSAGRRGAEYRFPD